MNLQQILDEADVLVPNAFTPSQKVAWINDINRSFFEIVKIPLVHTFNTTASLATYTLPAGVTSRNITRVMVGTSKYLSFQNEDVPPGNSGWALVDSTLVMTLTPAPLSVVAAYVRYMKVAAVAYTTTSLAGQTPEAPDVYHEIYIFGLAEKMALAMDDIAKGSNYGQQYRALLSVAQSNYMRE